MYCLFIVWKSSWPKYPLTKCFTWCSAKNVILLIWNKIILVRLSLIFTSQHKEFTRIIFHNIVIRHLLNKTVNKWMKLNAVFFLVKKLSLFRWRNVMFEPDHKLRNIFQRCPFNSQWKTTYFHQNFYAFLYHLLVFTSSFITMIDKTFYKELIPSCYHF